VHYFDYVLSNPKASLQYLIAANDEGETLSSDARRALFQSYVEVITLETSYKCNRKCDYCPVKASTRITEQSLMSEEIFEKIISELREIRYEKRITLNLYNEPLLEEGLEERIRSLKVGLPFSHVSLSSNGDRLTRLRLKSLRDAGLDQICITFHPLPGEILTESMLKKRFSKLAGKLSLPPTPEPDFTKKGAKEAMVSYSLPGVDVIVQWQNWNIIGTTRGGFLSDHREMRYERNAPCAKPFREFTIYYDGSVQPCCEIFRDNKISGLEIGNIAEESIYDLYSSSRLSLFRRSVFSHGPKTGVCKTCSAPDYSDRSDNELRKSLLSSV